MPVDVMPKQSYPEVYLGDGLYASYDGFGVTLRAPREEGSHWVYMEPAVMIAFERWIIDLKQRLRHE